MKKDITVLAQIIIYREVGCSDDRVGIEGDMSSLGQGMAALMDNEPGFADTVIATIDFYRFKRLMSYEALGNHIKNRVEILTSPGKTTAT